MIKKLRIKLIAVAMLAMFIVLATIVTAINIMNYTKTVSDADSILSVIRENDGKFPEPSFKPDGLQNNQNPELNASVPPDKLNDNRDFRDFRDPLNSPETRYESRFFSVKTDASGDNPSLISMEVAAISEDEALLMAKEAAAKSADKGFYSNYRYLKAAEDDGFLVIFLDCTRSLATARNTLITSVLVSLAGLGAVFILVLIFSRRIVRPVSESYDKQKEFITNAGHEIKTPLSIISADAEVIEMENGESEWTDDIKNQIKRLTSLTNDLVFLAKMEEHQKAAVTSEFSLSELVSEMGKSFKSRAKTGKKTFAMDVEDGITFKGEEPSIEKLLSILLDNAVKYTPDGGYIYTNLSHQKNKLVLSVSNTVKDELSKEALDHFFDRFYRTEKSRNSKTGGYGIGLSVARAVAERHNAKIRAFNKDRDLLCIEVVLPR